MTTPDTGSPIPPQSPVSSSGRKRSLSGQATEEGHREVVNKRQKTGHSSPQETTIEDAADPPVSATAITTPSPEHQAQLGLKRSIALALQHVGFDGATPEAMESYAATVETCMIVWPGINRLES